MGELARWGRAAGLVLGLSVLALGDGRPEAGAQRRPHELRLVVTDSGIRGPARVEAGHVVLYFDNHASQPHQIALWQVPRGRTREQEIDSMRAGRPPQGLLPAGGIGPLAAGQSGSLLMRLPPGQYVVFCQLNARNGDPYYKHRMLTTLDVTGEASSDLPYELAYAGVIMADVRIQFGATVPRGDRRMLAEGVRRRGRIFRGQQSIWIESFAGPTHALVLLKSNDPTDMARYSAWLDGRGTMPPVVSGLPAVPPGQRAFLRVNLTPGGYILFCPNPHQRTGGLRGYQTGEFTQFAVR